MALFVQQYAVGIHESFRSRVQMALIRHAQFRHAAEATPDPLRRLAQRVLDAPVGYAETVAKVVATEPGVQTGIEASPIDGLSVTDTQIQTAVESVYPSFVR